LFPQEGKKGGPLGKEKKPTICIRRGVRAFKKEGKGDANFGENVSKKVDLLGGKGKGGLREGKRSVLFRGGGGLLFTKQDLLAAGGLPFPFWKGTRLIRC